MLRATFIAVLVTCGLSCSSADPERTVTQSLPRMIARSGSASLFGDGIRIDLDPEARSGGRVTNVLLERVILRIDAASPTQTFDWADEIHIFVESTDADSQLPRREVASAFVPRGLTELELLPSARVPLLPYVREGAWLVSVEKRQPVSEDVIVEGRVDYRITIEPPPCRGLGASHRC
ncbi:MAG: hypothetical protein KF795_00480 [Labilithrix sp.]|nr:hypothetical protein [Labilithrix sp.]